MQWCFGDFDLIKNDRGSKDTIGLEHTTASLDDQTNLYSRYDCFLISSC